MNNMMPKSMEREMSNINNYNYDNYDNYDNYKSAPSQVI